jgi:hypothetical protein
MEALMVGQRIFEKTNPGKWPRNVEQNAQRHSMAHMISRSDQ